MADIGGSREGPTISVVIPVRNEAETIERCLEAVLNQTSQLEEVIVVDDGSTDETGSIVKRIADLDGRRVTLVNNRSRGPSSATNSGILRARGDIVWLVDGDAIVDRNWIKLALPFFEDPEVGGVAGTILPANPDTFWAAFAGCDIGHRFAGRLKSQDVGHISTCATAYRRNALLCVGLFDEQIRYGYDKDMSYRLKKAGYRLVVCKDLKVEHFWKEGLFPYIRQQCMAASGYLSVILKHKERRFGDEESGPREFVNIILFYIGCLSILVARGLPFFSIVSTVCILTQAGEGVILAWKAEYRVSRRFKILFPIGVLVRNMSWSIGLFSGLLRHVYRRIGT